MRRKHPMIRKLLLDAAAAGLALMVFALFHHVLPRAQQSLNVQTIRPVQAEETAVPETEETKTAEAQNEEKTAAVQLSLFDEPSTSVSLEDELKKAGKKLCCITAAARMLSHKLEKEERIRKLLYDIEFPLVITLDKIERNGMHVSGEKLSELQKQEKEADQLGRAGVGRRCEIWMLRAGKTRKERSPCLTACGQRSEESCS